MAGAPQLCGSDGQWANQTACSAAAPTCALGICTGPRCAGLPATCGPSANEDCCSSPLVTGGSVIRDYDGVMNKDKSYTATVSSFRLDRFEVTVGRFRAFLAAGRGVQTAPPAVGAGAHSSSTGWKASWNSQLAPTRDEFVSLAAQCSPSYRTFTDTPGNNENRAINCVNWYDAFAFCAWDGGFLPTEAEWYYAAAGGAEQRYYPWSEPITDPPSTPFIDDTFAVYGKNGPAALVGSKSPKGDGKWKQADLNGNLEEFLLDSYVYPYASSTCVDCSDQSIETTRAMRGGNIASIPIESANRSSSGTPGTRFSSRGFRCARPQ